MAILENTVEIEPKEVTMCYFQRGSGVLELKIINRIESEDKFKGWFINDFKDLGKYQNIRKVLQKLEKKGIIRKIKTYPVFWERI